MIDALVVGLGKMGLLHLAAYHWLARRGWVRRVFVHDVNPSQVAAALTLWPQSSPWLSAQTTSDATSLQPWCASVCVPPCDHLSVSASLIDAGARALLIEKPLALTTADADALLSHASAAGVAVLTGHSERFNPALSLTALRDALSAPLRAPLRLAIWRQARPRHPAALDVVRDLMIHDLDLATLWFGPSPTLVHATSPAEGVACARLVWERGDEALLRASAHVAAGARPKRRLHLSRGATLLVDLDLSATPVTVTTTPLNEGTPPDPVTAQALHLVMSAQALTVAAGGEVSSLPHAWPVATGEDGRAALALAERILCQWSASPTAAAGW
jgi:predicted dehydrogenase